MISVHLGLLDFLIAAYLFIEASRGFYKGCLQQVASVIPWWGAIMLGVVIAPWLMMPLSPYVTAPLLPYAAALAGSSLVYGFLTFGVRGLSHVLKKSPLSWVSPLLGGVLGISYASLWVVVLILACSFEPLASQSLIKSSLIVQKGLALFAQIAYFELWKGMFLTPPSWFNHLRTYFKV